MNKQRSLEIKVGIVSIVALILFIGGIVIGRGINVAISQKTVKLRFTTSGGITVSSPVSVNGVKRGSVTSVRNDNGSVLVAADLDDVSDLKEDASARISILEITGGRKIEINPGKSATSFALNKEINGTTAADLSDLVSSVGEVMEDGKTLIKRLDTLTAGITPLFGDKQLMNKLKLTFDNAYSISSDLNSILSANKNDISVALKNLHTISGDLKSAIQKNEPRLDTILTKFESTLDDARTALKKALTTADKADTLIGNLNSITRDLKTNQGVAGRLIYDKELAARLDSSLNSLSDFVKQIKLYGININARLGTRP